MKKMKQNISNLNSKNWFVYVFLLIPFFDISYLLNSFPITEKIFDIWLLISIFFLILLFCKDKKYSKILNYIFLYFAILIFSTFINGISLLGCVRYSLKAVGLCFLTDYGIRNDTKSFLNSLEFWLGFLVISNFISLLLFPDGMYTNGNFTNNWILGYKNSHILYILPLIMISLINSYYTYGKFSKKNWLLIILAILSLIIAESSTSLIGIFLVTALIIYDENFKSTRILNIKNYFIAYIILFFSIVILRIQNIFKFLIVDTLHKDLTFTSRTLIWDKALEIIKIQDIFGKGMTAFGFSESITSTHNLILNVLYQTGIIGLIACLLAQIVSVRELYKIREYKIAKIISIVLFSFFIMMITEAYSLQYVMYLYVFAYNAKYFIRKLGDS